MANSVRKLVLPFAVPAQDRQEAFSHEMERAAVFCLAELDRKRGGGIFKRKGTGEEILFITKFCYPMWIVPWNGRTLSFDGLGVAMHKLHYNTLPDVKAFTNDINVSAKTREAYSAFLADRLNFFKDFGGTEERVIEGLREDANFVQDLADYLTEAKPARTPLIDRALLAPNLDDDKISSIIQDLSNHRSTLDEDIANLRQAMKLLSTTTEKHIKAIREGIKETRKEFDEKIRDLESSLTRKTSRIRKRYDQKITLRTHEIESKLHRLHQKRVKVERTRQSTTTKIERCEAEIRSCRLNKDSAGEVRWKEELETCRKKISLLDKDIGDLDNEIESATVIKRQEVAKIRSECDDRVETAMHDLRDMEAARDASVQMNEKEVESIRDSTRTVVDQLDNLVKAKRAALDELDKVGISKRMTKLALAHLPFYLVCYQEKLKNRYTLYPPSIASSMGILTKFKGVFGAAKMKSILEPRSKGITTLLSGLLPLIEQNPVFEKEIVDAGIEASIFRTKDLCSETQKGLEELKMEGWVSDNELQMFKSHLEKP